MAVLAILGFDAKIPGLRGGFTGIDVLLTVLGYLTCLSVYPQARTGLFDLQRFYATCLMRVVPALSFVLIFCFVVASLVLSPWEAYRMGDTAVASALFSSNFLFIIKGGYFTEKAFATPLLMTWLIAIQMQFYALFPYIVQLTRTWKGRNFFAGIATLSGLSLLLSIYAESRYPIWNFYLPFTRAWELGAGVMLAIARVESKSLEGRAVAIRNVAGLVGVLILFICVLSYRPEMQYPGYTAMLPVLGSILILVTPNALPSRLLNIPPLVRVGGISFSLYLWHWPLLSFAEILSSKPLQNRTVCLLIVIALVAAIASHRLVEILIRAGRDLSTKAILTSSGICVLFLVSAGLLLYRTRGLPWRNATLYKIESDAALYRHYPCISAGSYLRLSSQCAPSPDPKMPAIAVLGGGHAEALASGLQQYASKNGWRLVTLTRESCPPTKEVSQWSYSDSTLAQSCRTFNRAALDYVRSRPDIRAVVLVGRWRASLVRDDSQAEPWKQNSFENDEDLKVGLQNEVTALTAVHKHVIVIEDVPEFPYDPVQGVRAQNIPLRRVINRLLLSHQPEQGNGASEKRSTVVSVSAEKAASLLAEVKSDNPGLILIDPKQVLCQKDRCYYANGSTLYYVDSIHLSRAGAEKVTTLFPDVKSLE